MTRTVPTAHRRRAAGLLTVILAGALALAGCSSDTKAPGEDTPSDQTTAAGMTLQGAWPLTGEPLETEAPDHPVVVVKIDNTSSSSPQIGLGKADLVTEELVEGGATRLAVFYQQHLPKVVGPVRSMRATDIGIIQPAKAVLVASGGAPPTVRRVADAKIRTFTEGAKGYYRESSRSAPYNLFMRLPELARGMEPAGTVPEYLPWGSPADFPKGQKAREIGAKFSAGHTTNWKFQRGKYVNLNSYAADGDHYAPDTVLVLRVEVGDAGYRDPAGNPVPETHFTGKGEAIVFHGGRMVRGTWAKKGYQATVELQTKAGPLELPPGNVWIELVPRQGGDVTVTR